MSQNQIYNAGHSMFSLGPELSNANTDRTKQMPGQIYNYDVCHTCFDGLVMLQLMLMVHTGLTSPNGKYLFQTTPTEKGLKGYLKVNTWDQTLK